MTGEKSGETTSETPKTIPAVIFDAGDVAYEEEILRNPFSLRGWQRYIEHKTKTGSSKAVCLLYERALKQLPGSYKLWYKYLKYRRRLLAEKCPTEVGYEHLNNVYERALVFMYKMPRIWLDYCDLLTRQGLLTRTRAVFDRALRALPITQHDRLWPLYISFLTSHNIPETTIRVYRRYLKLNPRAREDFVEYLKTIDRLDDAAQQLAILVNQDALVSEHGKTTHQLWTELCELVSRNPDKVFSLSVEAIVRQGIRRYTDQVGVLWCALADYYIRAAHFEKARDIYEEAIITVQTVRDFTQVFDAYAAFEERATAAKMTSLESDPSEDGELELDWLFARFEHLMDRRPVLLNSVLLRQNPHNVHEWLKRVELFQQYPAKQIETFTEAVKTVEPKLATGKLHTIWIAFAKFYENNGQLDDARAIFEKGLEPLYVKVDDLASVWCEYVEFELRHKQTDRALKLLRRATAPPPSRTHFFDDSEPVQRRVYKSLKLWSLYADVEESFGQLSTCRAVYERVLDLRIATPQIVINYAMFLEDNQYFEDAFKAYEKGIALFKWPLVFDIWNLYLTKFIQRYGGKKLERARDLFEQCLESCPPNLAKNIYLLYAKLEEEHGLARHAMNIYNRATLAVEREQMHSIFNIYIKKAMSMYGITSTRPIFLQAIQQLPEDRSREMSVRFAEVERNLGEIDRARAIYSHCSEICDPRVHPQFWETWKEFEMKHGNEDTVREMLRIKRSVQATYNTNVNFMTSQMLATTGKGGTMQTPGELTAGDSMALLEARAQRLAAEQDTSRAAPVKLATGGNISFVRGETRQTVQATTENPDEIAIEGDSDEGDDAGDDDDDVQIEQKSVPSAVFGSLVKEE